MLIKLTKFSWENIPTPVLIGTESIVTAENVVIKNADGRNCWVTKIQSRGAMVETTYVVESVNEIHALTLEK